MTEATATKTKEITMRDAITEGLREEMEADSRVFLLGEDIKDPFGGVYQVNLGFSTKFGDERVRETPISESAIIGCAIGAAMAGLRPVPEIMIIDFFGICMDQVCNHLAKLRFMCGGQVQLPVTIRTTSGAGAGFGAQHSQSLEAWLCHVPGLKVAFPSNPYDAKGLLKSAIRDDDPVLFIENPLLYYTTGQIPEGEYVVPLGSADVKREGSDITVISWGRQTNEALSAAETLAAEGISVEVVDPRTLVPLDRETILNSVRKTHRALITHEAVERAGYGAEIAAIIAHDAFDVLDAPIERVCGLNTPIPYARPLESAWVPDRERIARGVRLAIGAA